MIVAATLSDVAMTIARDGSIGIGTTSPYGRLSVAGEAVARNFTATSTPATSSIANALYVATSTPTQNLLFAIGSSSPLMTVSAASGKIGFGGVNTSPSRWAFGDGTNVNINPNINPLVQDASDARMAVCTSDDCIALKSALGNLGLFAYDYFVGAPKTLTLQEFGGILDISVPTVKEHTYASFSYSTSTAWGGTTTIPLGPAYGAEDWVGAKCFTDAGTLQVSFSDGSNRMNWMQASTTVGTITLNSNDTFTAGEKRYVDIGTPASSPTRICCTIDKIVNN